MTTASTDPTLTDTGSPWIFRCLADDVLPAKAIAVHVFGEGARRTPRPVALLSQNNRYGRMGIAEVARAADVAGARIVLQEGFESGTTEFSALAAGVFARRLAGRMEFNRAYHGLRADLGRAILLGLELLVIADIIGTVAIQPTFHNLGVLAAIVAIRTLLSFTLELEVSGRWPWQREEPEAGGK